MNPLIQRKQTTSVFLIALGLACFGLLPTARAVTPPPDGGYPGHNTAEGDSALFSLTTGTENTAIGYHALNGNTDGVDNTAIGYSALSQLINENDNTAVGAFALAQNRGDDNTAIGESALASNAVGVDNTAIGRSALSSNTSGSNNVALGYSAGSSLLGSNNIDIGANVNGLAGESNTIRIGKRGTHQKIFVAGIRGTTIANGQLVVIDSNGRLGTPASSARFKEAIKPMDKASEAILALKPVTFRYKEELDPDHVPQFGLIAEEVEKVNPDLVVRDEDGKVNAVRYEAVDAMLLNEFLKEHRTVQGQQKEIDALKTELKEQKALIQKVSAQLEASKPAPRVVNNP